MDAAASNPSNDEFARASNKVTGSVCEVEPTVNHKPWNCRIPMYFNGSELLSSTISWWCWPCR